MDTDEHYDEPIAIVEKMETDDTHHSTPKRSENEFQPEASTVDERTLSLSRILDAIWDDNCVGKIIVSQTAFNRSEDDVNASINYEDLASQILVEIAMEYFDGKLVDVKDSTESDKWKANTSSSSSSSDVVCTCPTPMMRPFNPANEAVFKYFLGSFVRCEREVLKYNDAQSLKKFDSVTVANTLTMIGNVKQQIIRYTILLLANKLRPSTSSEKSPLFKLLLENEIPSDFLRCIVDEASKKPTHFNTIFDEVINSLNIYMQCNATTDPKLCTTPICSTPIVALNELLNLTLIDEPTVRPICNLIAKKKNFYPTLTTEFTGREITKTSFLGPFLSVSVFSEDNPRILDDENKKQDLNHITDNLRSVSWIPNRN